jgi:hypothetical protein
MIVVVLGMHRSGTSALAGLLHSNGITMGRDNEFHPPPMKENPKGFYENHRFRVVNDNLLKEYNYHTKSFSPNIPTVDYQPTRIAINLVLDYEMEFKNWGFKDPRTCITLPMWIATFVRLNLLHKVKFILMERNPYDVAVSMLSRGNKEKVENQFVDLACAYNRSAVVNLNRYYLPKMVHSYLLHINFADLLNRTEYVANLISGYVGLEINNLSFIDPNISSEGGVVSNG